jgi:hypothetical protein
MLTHVLAEGEPAETPRVRPSVRSRGRAGYRSPSRQPGGCGERWTSRPQGCAGRSRRGNDPGPGSPGRPTPGRRPPSRREQRQPSPLPPRAATAAAADHRDTTTVATVTVTVTAAPPMTLECHASRGRLRRHAGSHGASVDSVRTQAACRRGGSSAAGDPAARLARRSGRHRRCGGGAGRPRAGPGPSPCRAAAGAHHDEATPDRLPIAAGRVLLVLRSRSP